MTESIYQYVLDQLEGHKGKWPTVAAATGIPRSTIVKIARKEVKDPGVSHIEKLAFYFREQTKASNPRLRA